MVVLNDVLPNWREKSLFEASPIGALSQKFASEAAAYTWSHHLPEQEFGTVVDGVRSENLQALSFPDDCFGVVVTLDVFEHILRPDLAFREVARVLQPDGLHVFTVPIFAGRQTFVRVEPGPDGTPIYLMEPDYHGDPTDPNGSLVIREWGDDIVEYVREVSGLVTERYCRTDRRFGLDGEFLDVLVSRKSNAG
jgi:SAM-dependent methyltransferase